MKKTYILEIEGSERDLANVDPEWIKESLEDAYLGTVKVRLSEKVYGRPETVEEAPLTWHECSYVKEGEECYTLEELIRTQPFFRQAYGGEIPPIKVVTTPGASNVLNHIQINTIIQQIKENVVKSTSLDLWTLHTPTGEEIWVKADAYPEFVLLTILLPEEW